MEKRRASEDRADGRRRFGGRISENPASVRKGTLPVIWHFIKLSHRIYPGYLPLAIASAALGAIAPFPGIVLPGCILDELTGPGRRERLLLYIAALALGNAIVGLAGSVLKKRLRTAGERLADGFELHVGQHIMRMDFGKLEDAGILDMKEKALFNIKIHDALLGGPRTMVDILRLAITLAFAVGMIAALSPVLVAVLLGLVAGNAWVYRRIQATKDRFYQDIAVYNRQFGYFRELTQDFRNAKDVRIYRMWGYIRRKIRRYHDSANQVFHEMFLRQRRNDGVSAAFIQAQTLAAYAFAVWGVCRGTLMIGGFAMQVSAANQVSAAATQLLAKLVDLQMLGKALEDYLAFEALPEEGTAGERAMPSAAFPARLADEGQEGKRARGDMGSVEIEFRNVWFRYPNARDYALKDISLLIKSGERLSLVGRNGAGKTTFIKLLCRLYRPQRGCILLNGIDIAAYQETEYRKIIAVAFQDFKIFSCSVRENLSFGEAAGDDRVRAALERAGILERIEGLPLGIDTPLYREFGKEGVELSGGEMQKIAIARVMYRDAPLVVLDEPTASLDPYAEQEVFRRFGQATEGRTAIYISHRLSSCRFCDAVAVFDQGRLAEYGSHERLVRDGKLYAKMWEAQAHFYR